MKLYSYWRSTAAYRVRIALNIKNIPHKIKAIHLVKDGGEHLQQEYQSINPQSLVPALVLDSGDVITQSLSIIDFLEESYPQQPLYPLNLADKAKAKAMALSIACDIHPLNNLRVLKYLKNQEWQQAKVDQWYAHWIHQGFAAIEKQLGQSVGRFCFGDSITVADIFLVAQVYNANRFKVSLDQYPQIIQVNDNCLEHSAFIKAMPENQSDCKN